MQQIASIKTILEEMDKTALRETCLFRNMQEEHRNTAPYVAALERLDWSEDQKKRLIEILKSNKKRDEGVFRSAQVVKSDDLAGLSDEEIISALKSSPPKKTREGEILAGFQDIVKFNNEIKGTFVGMNSRLVIINDEALLENKIIFVPFSISRHENNILIKTSRQNDSRICREKLQEILDLEKLYYASPEGLREGGTNADEHNACAKGFIDSLNIEEINGVYLRIGGDTKIKSINYRGQGDILAESKIKDDIENGALIVGVKGLIRNGEILIDFSINWWWLPLIKVSSDEISPEVADEVVVKIAKSYSEHILK